MFDSGACSVRAVRARASAVLRLPLILFVVGLDQLSFVTVSFPVITAHLTKVLGNSCRPFTQASEVI